MPRIGYILIFAMVSLVPFFIFGFFSRPSMPQAGGTPGSNTPYYHRPYGGFNSFLLGFGGGWLANSYRHRSFSGRPWGSSSPGRSFSSQGFQGGGPGYGK